jgi:hypothetical protein
MGFEGFEVFCDRGVSVEVVAPEEEVDAVLMREVMIVGILTDERLTCGG